MATQGSCEHSGVGVHVNHCSSHSILTETKTTIKIQFIIKKTKGMSDDSLMKTHRSNKDVMRRSTPGHQGVTTYMKPALSSHHDVDHDKQDQGLGDGEMLEPWASWWEHKPCSQSGRDDGSS